jgi:PmbA protein
VIEQVLDAIRRNAEAGDACWRRDERTSIGFESGRLKAAGMTQQIGVNVRLVQGGRVGVAGTTATEGPPDDLIARALASAELGERVDLPFPGKLPLPHITTHFPRAESASVADLVEIGRTLMERLRRPDLQVNVSVDREVEETAVANTAGAEGRYAATGVAVSADVTRVAGDDVLMVYDQYIGCDLPSAGDLDAIVNSIETRLTLGTKLAEPPHSGALPVVFTPGGLSAILMPLQQALSGKAVLQGISPLAGKIGTSVFDAAISLTDDPLVPGRTGSRPIDAECVPAARLPLVEKGVVRHFIYDLETAARVGNGTRSTGHGHRGTFGKPHVGFTNLIVGALRGAPPQTQWVLGGGLVKEIQDGLLIDDLIGVGQGNVIGGAFSHPVALAYRIEHGEITGRVKNAAVAGNVYDLLKKIGGLGNDGRWLGSLWTPSLLLEGVSVAGS